tara:strand:+ start:627 stop:824 length:198 start_codon:yes stop_codon:yes gene_type:complete
MKVSLKKIYGYRRRATTLNKDSVSLSPPPWQQGEQHDEHDKKGREGMGLSSKKQKSRKRRGSQRV